MEQYFSYRQSKIFYRRYGNGLPAIVLLHGFAEDGNVWKEQIDFLEKYFTVVVPDLPGSGRSVDGWQLTVDSETGLPQSTINNQQSTIEYYADCIYSLLRNENVETCVMLGHSMGGYIALAFAEKYPEMLLGFGFVNSTAFADSAEKKEARKKGIELMKEYGACSFIKTTAPNLFSSAFKKNYPERVEALIEKGKNFSAESLVQYYSAMMNRPDRTNVLRGAKFPVLFIAGEEDAAAPLSDVLQQVYLPATSYIYILKNVAHMSMWEAAEKVNGAIFNFIKEMAV